jgi:pimeloyl-ACP methyl ester carboxylesterase
MTSQAGTNIDTAQNIAHTTGRAPSGGVHIAYRLFGKPGAGAKTPVIIVHGLSYFSYDWIAVAAALATDRQVAAIDMRGFGDSDWPGEYGVPAMANDLVAVMDHLGWAKAVLLGHSMGGRSCVWCAAETPQRVAGLVLVDYSPDNAPGGSKRVATTVAGTPDVFASIDAAIEWSGTDPHSPAGRDLRARFEAYLKPVPGGFMIKRDLHFAKQFRHQIATGERHKLGVDLWEALSRVAMPVRVVRGTRSDMFADETMPKMRAAGTQITLVEVDSGHHVAGDNPEALLRETRDYLATTGN